MTELDREGARLTVWPQSPIKSGYWRFTRYHFDPTRTMLGTALDGDGPEYTAWRGQTYLEIFALNLDDLDAIGQFVNAFGTLNVFKDWDLLIGGLTGVLPSDVEDRVFGQRRSFLEAGQANEWLAGRVVPGLGNDPQWHQFGGEDPEWEWCETVAEFRFGACVIRDLTRAWMIVRDGNPHAEVDWELLDSGEFPGFLTALDHAQGLLGEGLSAILAAVHPYVALPGSFSNREEPWRAIATTSPGEIGGGLAVVCALELFNDIVAHTPYKVCKFEGCQRVFTFQQERMGSPRPAATAYKSRRDALFCSPQCRLAHTQRMHRRRKAQRPREAETGL